MKTPLEEIHEENCMGAAFTEQTIGFYIDVNEKSRFRHIDNGSTIFNVLLAVRFACAEYPGECFYLWRDAAKKIAIQFKNNTEASAFLHGGQFNAVNQNDEDIGALLKMGDLEIAEEGSPDRYRLRRSFVMTGGRPGRETYYWIMPEIGQRLRINHPEVGLVPDVIESDKWNMFRAR